MTGRRHHPILAVIRRHQLIEDAFLALVAIGTLWAVILWAR